MPLPLYGSGLCDARISARTCPTFCLSAPFTEICVPSLSSTSTVTPSGGVSLIWLAYPTDRTIDFWSIRAWYPSPSILSFFSYPWETPTTMLLISARVSPCRARFCRSSSGRVTVICLAPVSCFTCIFGWKVSSSFPFFPSTRILPSASVTLTSAGSAIGCFPTRDMATPLGQRVSRRQLAKRRAGGGLSPYDAQHLTADPFLAGLAVAHDTLRCAQDGDAEPVEHLLQLLGPLVVPVARPTGPADGADHLLALCAVLQIHAQDGPRLPGLGAVLELGPLVLADLEVEDEPLVLEHLGDVGLQLCGLHLGGRPLDRIRVANPGQHVGDRVGHHVSEPSAFSLQRLAKHKSRGRGGLADC